VQYGSSNNKAALVPAADHLEIRESSRVRTPFATYFLQDRIGTPVNWMLSAVGRAYNYAD
jgi:IclR family transcriptional regulator, mhp operon transcriptional activator